MASIGKEEREEGLRQELLEGAPGFILMTGIDGGWIEHLCRHYGHTPRKFSGLFPSKPDIAAFLLTRHLELAFEAVCMPGDWEGAPMDVLRAMSLALVCYGSDRLERHRVFLAEYERGPEARRAALGPEACPPGQQFPAGAACGHPWAEVRQAGHVGGNPARAVAACAALVAGGGGVRV